MGWIREFFQILAEYKQARRVCPSCEILKIQLEFANTERTKFLNKLLEPVPQIPIPTPEMEPVPPRHIPWNVRRQMLEKEDRERARLMRDAPKPDQSISELEKELGVNDAS